MPEWSARRTIVLIRLYQREACLWDARHADHRSAERRHRALERVARGLGGDVHVAEIKKKMKNLCSQYYRERAKLGSGSPSTAKPPKWFAYAHMHFLKGGSAPAAAAGTGTTEMGAEAEADSGEAATQFDYPQIDDDENSNGHCQRNEDSSKFKKMPSDTFQDESNTHKRIWQRYEIKPDDPIVKEWIFKLNRMTPKQQMLARKFIQDVILVGELGGLLPESVRIKFDVTKCNATSYSHETKSRNDSESMAGPSIQIKAEAMDDDNVTDLQIGIEDSTVDANENEEKSDESNTNGELSEVEPSDLVRTEIEFISTDNDVAEKPQLPTFENFKGPKKKRKEWLASKLLQDDDDEFCYLGLTIAVKLKQINEINPRHRIFCEKMINDTLYLGLMQNDLNS